MFHTNFNEKTKQWIGSNIPPLLNPNINIAQMLLRSMQMFGSKLAQVSDDSGVCLTFEEIRMMTIRAAQNLQSLGYKPKQVVGVMCENLPNLSPIVFAAFSIGCPINILSPSVEKPDVIRMLKITEPSVMFCDVKVYDLIKECLNELNNDATIFTFNGMKSNSKAVETLFKETGFEESFIPAEVDGINDIAAILCSSGTTGPFKGVCLSHANILAEIIAFNVCNADDVLLNTSSLQWISGHNTLILGTLNGATRIITTQSFSPELQMRLIENYKVTKIISLTYHMISMLKCNSLSRANLSSVKRFFIRGHRAPYAMVKEFNTYLPNGKVGPAYGLTEMSGVVAVNLNDSGNSAGQILNGFNFKIVDKDGNRCKYDMHGEICIKPPYKFLGYYRNPELTSTAIDNEGFVLTGDIGFFDINGNVNIIDRKKDLIAYEFEISPFEIEEFLIKSPDVKAVCVVGVVSKLNIELPAAVIIREKGSQITKEEIYKMVSDNMVDYCKLRGGVYFVDSIPTTPSGKLLRRWCKETANCLFSSNGTIEIEVEAKH